MNWYAFEGFTHGVGTGQPPAKIGTEFLIIVKQPFNDCGEQAL
ncbi:hypothetical protein [Geitlerinema sp. PCC 9228]|nr:hypothetical protein [Geitlerinema sp. PCC 9228]